jgi:hypothetical protein
MNSTPTSFPRPWTLIEIMLGVLLVILRPNQIAAPDFSLSNAKYSGFFARSESPRVLN